MNCDGSILADRLISTNHRSAAGRSIYTLESAFDLGIEAVDFAGAS
jgi:hypothetical protein